MAYHGAAAGLKLIQVLAVLIIPHPHQGIPSHLLGQSGVPAQAGDRGRGPPDPTAVTCDEDGREDEGWTATRPEESRGREDGVSAGGVEKEGGERRGRVPAKEAGRDYAVRGGAARVACGGGRHAAAGEGGGEKAPSPSATSPKPHHRPHQAPPVRRGPSRREDAPRIFPTPRRPDSKQDNLRRSRAIRSCRSDLGSEHADERAPNASHQGLSRPAEVECLDSVMTTGHHEPTTLRRRRRVRRSSLPARSSPTAWSCAPRAAWSPDWPLR